MDMGKHSISRAEAISSFEKGVNCCQTTLLPFADKLGYEEEEFMDLAACFGGGMGMGETCGTVTGAMMVIGMAVGCETQEQRDRLDELKAEFQRRFRERHQSTMCRDILGFDVSIPGESEKAVEAGAFFDICPRCMEDSIDILEELLKDEL